MSGDLQSQFPELYQNALALHSDFMPIAFLIVFIGFSLMAWKASMGDISMLLKGILSAGIIALVIYQMPDWINQLQVVVFDLSGDMESDPSETHERFARLLLSDENQTTEDLSFWNIIWSDDVGMGEAVAYALIFLASHLALAVMWLYFILQQALLVYAIALTPIFLSFYMLESLKDVAGKFILGLVSISLWPLGWAIANLMTQSLVDMTVGTDDSIWGHSQSFFFLIILTLWILFSTIKAPLLISMLLTRGVNAGAALFAGFGGAMMQGATDAVGAGVTTQLMGGSRGGIAASSTLAGAAGTVTGSAGASNILMPTGIGLTMGALTSPSQNNKSYSERARELFQPSKS